MSMRKFQIQIIFYILIETIVEISFSLLLDDISLDQGGFFHKNSHKNPPPNFVDINDEKYEKISTTEMLEICIFGFR